MTAALTKDLEKLINDASDKGILMFCSVEDTGVATDTTYPGSLYPEKVFRIGAANPEGRPSRWTNDQCNYIFPGDKVRQEYWRYTGGSLAAHAQTIPALSGASIATALATGLAGVILNCALLSAIYVHTTLNSIRPTQPEAIEAARFRGIHDFEALRKTKNKMDYAFQQIGLAGEFVKVWERFEAAAADIEKAGAIGDTAEQMKVVCRLVQAITEPYA